jgi:small subunit ribosomal protein S8e
MVEWHGKSNKLVSGGKRSTVRRCTKKNAWRGGEAAQTKAVTTSKETRALKEGRGKTEKVRATATKYANVAQKGKIIKAEIIGVESNDANRLFARSNIATCGAIIKIRVGKEEKDAIITNRPGQDGVINAVLA